jgi:hypothetical protein
MSKHVAKEKSRATRRERSLLADEAFRCYNASKK